MSCNRCSKNFENKWVQCFDEQEISMHMKRSGQVKLQCGDTVEMTNFQYCPYCGDKLGSSNTKLIDKLAGMSAAAPIMSSLIPIEPTEMQTAIQKAIEESITKGMTIGVDLGKPGFDISGKSIMRGGMM